MVVGEMDAPAVTVRRGGGQSFLSLTTDGDIKIMSSALHIV